MPWACWRASSAEVLVLPSPQEQPGKMYSCCPWLEPAAAGLASGEHSFALSPSSVPQPLSWGYEELERGQVCHALWLQIKVLINVWDMYKILNLAEGTLTVKQENMCPGRATLQKRSRVAVGKVLSGHLIGLILKKLL